MKIAASLIFALFVAAAFGQPTFVPIGTPYTGVALPLDVPVAVTIDVNVPLGGSVSHTVATGRYANDPVGQRFLFDLGGDGGKQLTGPNGTYEIITVNRTTGQQACFYWPSYTYGYEHVAKSYATMDGEIRIDTATRQNVRCNKFTGRCLDGGAPNAYVAFEVDQDAFFNVPLRVIFSQGIPRLLVNGTCPASPLELKGSLLFDYSNINCLLNGCPAPDSAFALPSICWGVEQYQRWDLLFCAQ